VREFAHDLLGPWAAWLQDPLKPLRVEYGIATARLLSPWTKKKCKFERFTPNLLDWGTAQKQIYACKILFGRVKAFAISWLAGPYEKSTPFERLALPVHS
jgi:hypothetical protein